jgi:hypothetical protein
MAKHEDPKHEKPAQRQDGPAPVITQQDTTDPQLGEHVVTSQEEQMARSAEMEAAGGPEAWAAKHNEEVTAADQGRARNLGEATRNLGEGRDHSRKGA